jgi:hypothetical protein
LRDYYERDYYERDDYYETTSYCCCSESAAVALDFVVVGY